MSSQPTIRVALADDHPVFRDGVRQLLSLEPDLEVVAEANGGDQVIDVLKEHRPDVLLLDLSMPGLDGQTTLRRLRTETFDTKIIVLTASEDPEQHVRAVGCGASAVVLKQMATDSLTASIRRVYDGEVWLDGGTTAAIMRSFGGSAGADVKLTTRQIEVVQLVAQGFTNGQIAESLFVSEQTVKNHLHQITRKLGVSGRIELAHYAFDHGIQAVQPA